MNDRRAAKGQRRARFLRRGERGRVGQWVCEGIRSKVCENSFEIGGEGLGFGPDDEDVPLVVRGKVIATALAVPRDGKECGRDRLGWHDAGGIGDGLREDSLVESDGQVLRVVVDRGVGRVLQFDPEDERVFLLETPNVPDMDCELVVVVRDVWRRVKDAGESVGMVFDEERIGLGLVHE